MTRAARAASRAALRAAAWALSAGAALVTRQAAAADDACRAEGRVLVAARDGELATDVALALGDAGVSAEASAPGIAPGPCDAVLRVEPAGGEGGGPLRVTLQRPGRRVVLLREEVVPPPSVGARAVVMARDLLEAAEAMPTAPRPPRPAPTSEAVAPSPVPDPPSSGRLPLAVGSTAIGGFTGLGVYLATGSDDPRILYPMLATGAGIGLGGSLLVSGEWDVRSADAWFVIAGGLWPTAAGHLLYEGRFADRRGTRADQERWTYGLVGTTAGLGLSTLAIALRRPTDGDAALVHSGAGYGAVLGGLAEYAVRGDIGGVPEAGLGYGAAVGWLAAGTLSLHVDLEESDVLALDLGAILGGLGGAALASPLVFDEPSAGAQRAFLAIAAGSTLLGAGAGLWLAGSGGEASSLTAARPTIGVVGESVLGSERAPVYGAALHGALP